MTYWEEKGTYETEAKQFANLVPVMGPADTLKGEIFRAVTKIYYDYYNNGFGNHWMKPAAFLIGKVSFSSNVKDVLYDHGRGNIAYGSNYDDDVEEMMDTVIEYLIDVDDEKNTVDMWDYKLSSSQEELFAEEEEFDYDDEDY